MKSRRPKQPLPNTQVKLQNYITTSCGISSQWPPSAKAITQPSLAHSTPEQQTWWGSKVSGQSLFPLGSHCSTEAISSFPIPTPVYQHCSSTRWTQSSLNTGWALTPSFSTHWCNSSIFEAGSPLKSHLKLSAFEAMGQGKDDQCFPVCFHQEMLINLRAEWREVCYSRIQLLPSVTIWRHFPLMW